MRKEKRKEYLKKVIFVQHIVILIFICVGIFFVIKKTSARDITTTRENTNYINDSFWSQWPSTWDIFDALYSWQTAYTKFMSWYDYTNNSCNKNNINFIEITWLNEIIVLPQIVQENTIYILNGWRYAVIDKMILSWNCIGIIWKWNVELLSKIDTTKTKYSIIDNIFYHNNRITLQNYTISTWIIIQLENDTNTKINYIVTWNINQEFTWYILWNDVETHNASLNSWNNINILDSLFYEDYNVLNHNIKSVIHDNIFSTITWTILWTTTYITNNWLYNTGIKIQIYDTNLSGVFNNALLLSSGSNSYENDFKIEWIYNIITNDKANNQTWISFEIDTTAPIINNLQPVNNSTITGTSINLSRQLWENSTKIISQKYYLYTTWDILITSWVINPWITWTSVININKWTYKRQIEVKDKAWNIWIATVNSFNFNKLNIIFTWTTAYILWNTWYTNTNPVILFSWNKIFEWSIFTWITNATHFYKSWSYSNLLTTISETINRAWPNTGNLKVYLWYKTQDNEIWTWIFNFYIDKTVPSLWLIPLWWRRNNTWDIVYLRSGLNKSSWMIKYYTLSINNNMLYSWTNTTYTKTWIQLNQQYWAQVCAYDIAWSVWCSSTQTITIDQIAPQIHNVVNSWFYKSIPNPAPIIVDESGEAIYNITVKRNWTTILQTWNQTSPYVVDLELWEALYQIIASDEAGNSSQINFNIDTTFPTINLINPISWLLITWNNTVTFSWSWNDWYFSWYEFVLSGYSFGNYYTWIITASSSKIISNLNNWNYRRQVTIYDKAWNKTKSQVLPLFVDVPLTWQIGLWWITTIWYINYTRSWTVLLQTNINKPTIATISWNIVSQYWYNIINKEIFAGNQTTSIDLTSWEWQKYIYVNLKDLTDNQTIHWSLSVVVDSTWPSKPDLSSTNNKHYTWGFAISRISSTDNWAWVKEYNYIIEQNSITKKSWKTSTPSIAISNMELWLQWTFNIKVQAIDQVWNESSRSESAMFNYSWIPDTSPESFTFSRQIDVDINTIYRSNSVVISWLSTYTFIKAVIDEWNLFVNWINVNKESLVTNWDVLYIELRSSNNYYDVETSTLTISDKSSVFKLITIRKEWSDYYDYEDTNLSTTEIIELEWLYLLIVNLDSTLKETLKDMLEAKIDELIEEWALSREIAKLRYIYERLIDDINNYKDTIYTAPNGKKYTIIYKEWLWYTSINFSKTNETKYFATINEINAFIDKNNSQGWLNYTIDTSRSTAPYKAPNGKIYNLFKTTTWKYWSYNMVTPKLFDSLKLLQDYINKNNPKK